MKVYHYDRLAGELYGQSEAELDPIEGKPLIPAHATVKAPPAAQAGHTLVFDVNADKWIQKIDHRGQVYDAQTGESEQWAEIGPLPATKTILKPSTAFDIFTAGAWVTDLAAMKQAYSADVDSESEATRARYITSGSGQAVTYLIKESEARAFAAAGYPATAVPNMISADAAAFGITETQAADTIILKADAWKGLASFIERERLTGKQAISKAVDVAALDAAKAAAIKALQAI